MQCDDFLISHGALSASFEGPHHAEVIPVTCAEGYKLLAPGVGDGYGRACSNLFYARCLDGLVEFQYFAFPWTVLPPQCVRHCGALDDTCGEESCSTSASYNFVDNALQPTQDRVGHGSLQEVVCEMGHRVAPASEAIASCDASRVFQRDCQNCHLDPSQACRPLQCSLSTVEDLPVSECLEFDIVISEDGERQFVCLRYSNPVLNYLFAVSNGRIVGSSEPLFNEETVVQCDFGNRASTQPSPSAREPGRFKLQCIDNCSLVSDPPGLECYPVVCPAVRIQNATTDLG
eukprot:2511763-Rhodomonas_salina.1